jgi:hypothetical protein
VLWLGSLFGDAQTLERPKPIYQQISDGLYYSHFIDTNVPWSIHVARFQRGRRDLTLTCTLAQEHIVGLSTVVQQIATFPPTFGHPLAAVNGDFFLIKAGPYQGDPDGLQIERGELVSAPHLDSFWLERGTPHIEQVRSKFSVRLPNRTIVPFGLNETPRSNSVVLFTPRFGESTRATNQYELILAPAKPREWMPLRANQTFEARVEAINTHGNSVLATNRMVLTFGTNKTSLARGLEIGTTLTLSTDCTRNLRGAETAVGGRHILVHRGKENQWPEESTKPVAAFRNPRTAVGYNNHWVYLVVVDGRQKGLSMGMSFTELAKFMKELGCTDALNLDGGGSSTFWLDGKVLNSPSDKHERAVANALVLTQRAK